MVSILVSYTIPEIFMRKKPVSSFVRAQMVALHDAGFNQIQISIFLVVVYKMPSININVLAHLMIQSV